MKKTILIALAFIGLFPFEPCFAQARKTKIEKADIKYDNYEYIAAGKIYTELIKNGNISAEILKKLANTYYFNAKYDESLKWYRRFFEFIEEEAHPIYFLRYSQSLLASGKNKLAKKWYKKFLQRAEFSDNSRSPESYLSLIQQNSGRYRIKNLDINTEGIDYGGTVFNGNLVYASTKANGAFVPKSGWDGLNFLNLYVEKIENKSPKEINLIENLEGFGEKINTKFHESSASFTKDGNILYFTRSNISPVDIKKKEAQKLKIYRVTWKNGEWTNIEDLSINSDFYSNGHPALNPSEDKLYFASDRPGGYGETDLYVVDIYEDGNLGVPKNLGNKINTAGRETFPFITDEDQLFFSSNGHYGLGGLDVFYLYLNNRSQSNHIINVGKPINSPADDFAFTINTKTKKGYFSSTRKRKFSKGHSDIYSLREIVKIDQGITKILSEQIFTDVQKEITKNQKYKEEDTVNKPEVQIGEDLGKILDIVIHFDFDKSAINRDAAQELQKIVLFMKKYPAIKVIVLSHTDSRGSHSYNFRLSVERAKTTMRYLIEQGISEDRLRMDGRGEEELLNNCSSSVPCSEKEHKANRRSEFIISK